MAYDLSHLLVIGISSRALFDLETEAQIYEQQGLDAYIQYQLAHETEILRPGTAFPLVKGLLALNDRMAADSDKNNRNKDGGDRLVEVIVMSRNSPDTGLRIFNSIHHYGLDITRAAFSGGEPLAPYLNAFDVDLFLSKSRSDVQAAIDAGVAAALLYNPPPQPQPLSDSVPFDSPDGLKNQEAQNAPSAQDVSNSQKVLDVQDARKINQHVNQPANQSTVDKLRIAFDADAVLFSEESEAIYRTQGMEAFYENERNNADKPLQEGPFAKLLKTLSVVQQSFSPAEAPVRVAIVTARSSPGHERVIKTLRAWGVRVDAAFFLGGVSKDQVLKAFGAQIFFDDQEVHLGLASAVVPSGWVPYRTDSILHQADAEA